MRAEKLRRPALFARQHLLPDTDSRMWIVSSPSHQLESHDVSLGFLLPTVWKLESDGSNVLRDIQGPLSSTRQRREPCQGNPLCIYTRHALTSVLPERVRNLVPQHCSELGVGKLQFINEPAVNHDLATRHSIGIHFLGGEGVDFPFPRRSIRPEHSSCRNEPLGDAADTRYEPRILIELASVSGFLNFLCIRLLGALFHVLLGHEHALLSLDSNRPGCGRTHGCAGRASQAARNDQQ